MFFLFFFRNTIDFLERFFYYLYAFLVVARILVFKNRVLAVINIVFLENFALHRILSMTFHL